MGTKTLLFILISISFLGLISSLYFKGVFGDLGEKSFVVEKEESPAATPQPLPNWPASSISGISCENYNRRPFAVILAEDYAARPLSGISMADLVFEMPVITGSVTRLMAVFQCENPSEIGSIRSARHDFIPLAAGLDAIFLHWGGSHFALDQLAQKILDNIDALPNPYDVFYRKSGVPAPHNGFTSIKRIIEGAKKLEYKVETSFAGYNHQEIQNSKCKNQNDNEKLKIDEIGCEKSILEINYAYPYNVKYEYDPENNSYGRWRAGIKEMDKINGKQVSAENVVVMRAKSRQIEGQYNDVDVEGAGEAVYYQNGEERKGYWQKDKSNISSKLYFYDENDEEVKFVPGKIWINIVEPNQKVEWSFVK